MRDRNLSSIFYAPGDVPSNIERLPRYIAEENIKVATAINGLAAGHLDETHVAPEKPRDGDWRFADGTNWNPVAGGQGFYGYYAGAWHKLG
jgi:hypothetical protein